MVAYAVVMLIATISGDGATPVKLIPGGRGGSQLPVAAIPLLVGLFVILIFSLRRIIQHRALGSPPKKAITQDEKTGRVE